MVVLRGIFNNSDRVEVILNGNRMTVTGVEREQDRLWFTGLEGEEEEDD